MKPVSREMANKIYDILVDHAGASDSWTDRFSFVYHYSECPHTGHPPTEWRFCGKLGFGGKFWLGRFKVSCYPKDETPERFAIIKKTNAFLEELKSQYKN